MGPKMTWQYFDGSKKLEWLGADVNSLIHLWPTLTTLLIIGAAIVAEKMSGLALIGSAKWLVADVVGLKAAIVTCVAITFVTSFLWIFVFRRNPFVCGKRREFRYIFRWL